MRTFILDDENNPVEVNYMEAARWMNEEENFAKRQLAHTVVGRGFVFGIISSRRSIGGENRMKDEVFE